MRPLLGPGDGLSGTDFRLIVRASDRHFAEMQRVIQALDVARRSLTLTVKQGAVLDETRVEHQLSGDVRVGRDAHITLPSHGTGNGGEVTVSRGNSAGASRLQYRSERINSSKRDETMQVLRVLDGQSAFIQIGQSAPPCAKHLHARR